MTTFLMTWNPATGFSWSSLPRDVKRLRDGRRVTHNWSVGRRKSGVHVGDRFFMLRQGEDPRGIIGCGRITSEVYRDGNWRGAGSAMYAEVEFEALIDARREPSRVLTVDELCRTFPGYNFRFVRASGQEIPAPIADRLVEMWRERNGGPAIVPRLPQEIVEQRGLAEGAVCRIRVNAYERNREARLRCIQHWGAMCTVCGFDFEIVYGAIGRGFIEVHHLVPLSAVDGEYEVDPVKDLRPVCPNCHAMLHQSDPPLTITALRRVVRERQAFRCSR